jgi:RimJ/RimL family protein N-acetyltransferase
MTAHLVERPRVAARPDPGPCPVLQTARLTLRPHRLTDADAVAQSLGDYQVSRMLARVPVPYHRQDALDWLMRWSAGLDISGASASSLCMDNGISVTG